MSSASTTFYSNKLSSFGILDLELINYLPYLDDTFLPHRESETTVFLEQQQEEHVEVTLAPALLCCSIFGGGSVYDGDVSLQSHENPVVAHL